MFKFFFFKKMRQNINNLMIWIMEDVAEFKC